MYCPLCKGIRIPAFLIFACRIRNATTFFLWNPAESHSRLESRQQVPPTKNMYSTWNPEFKAWNPESNSALDSFAWSEGIVPVPHTKKNLQRGNLRKKTN